MLQVLKKTFLQVADETVQDRGAGRGGPHSEQGRVRPAVEQRLASGAGQVRSCLVRKAHHPRTHRSTALTRSHSLK